MQRKTISVVVPCYNEEEAFRHFYLEISHVAEHMEDCHFELVFIDDGSKDNTIELIKTVALDDERVKYVSFSRNFGKEAAIYAGLKSATGDYVVIMDVDLQDPPSLIPEMLKAVDSGRFDIAATRRSNRIGEPRIRSFFAKIFYKTINKLSKTEIVDGARDFRLMTRQVVDSILEMKEYNRFSKGIFGWVGFKTKWFEYDNIERVAGATKWSFSNLFIYSIEGIVAFSTAPLAIASVAGIILCLISLVMICIIITKTLIWGDQVSGWPSLACITVFIGGMQLLCTGIIGQYVAKTYLEAKDRPQYILRESNLRASARPMNGQKYD